MRLLLKTFALIIAIGAIGGCREDDTVAQLATLAETEAALDARVMQIADPAQREAANAVADFIVRFQRMRIWQAEPPQSVSYTKEHFQWMTDYLTLTGLVENYRNGALAFANPRFRSGTVVNITTPFTYPFDTTWDWANVTLTDGTIVPVSGDARPTPPAVALFNAGKSLQVIASAPVDTAEPPLPVRAHGTLKLDVPGALTRLSLTRSDLGDTHTVGAYLVTLQEMSGHIVTVEVARQDGGRVVADPFDVLIAATDETGQFLEASGNSKGPVDAAADGMLEVLTGLLTEIENGDVAVTQVNAEIDRRSGIDGIPAEHANIHATRKFFRGDVDTVEVVFASEIEEQTFPVDIGILIDPDNEYGDPIDIYGLPVNAVGYDYALGYLTAADRMIELSPQDVAHRIIVRPPRQTSSHIEVEFDYPEGVISAMFLSPFDRYEFDTMKVDFYDEDGVILTEQRPFEMTVDRIEYQPDGFRRTPARVAGSFDVLLMPGVQIETYPIEALPEGISVDGNQIIFPRNEERRFFGMDDDGRFLRRFETVTFSSSSDPIKDTVVDYYFGDPSVVLIVSPGEIGRVTYEFDVGLTTSGDG